MLGLYEAPELLAQGRGGPGAAGLLPSSFIRVSPDNIFTIMSKTRRSGKASELAAHDHRR